jgi:ligand-binding SRPBCC domain-containing protein
MFRNQKIHDLLNNHTDRVVETLMGLEKLKNMRIRYVTTVMAPFRQVYEGFNQKLLEYLMPPFNVASVSRYEGQNPGDIIDIKFHLPLINNWTVIVKESWLSHREYGFTDRGLRVPAGIVYWKHIHRVVARNNESSFIIDDIEFETHWQLLDYLLYIPLWLLFYLRRPLYKKYFNRLKNRIFTKSDKPSDTIQGIL